MNVFNKQTYISRRRKLYISKIPSHYSEKNAFGVFFAKNQKRYPALEKEFEIRIKARA